MSNSALSGCGIFLWPVWDHGLYPHPIGLRLVGWIFSRLADQNHPLMFFGSKSLRPSQPVVGKKKKKLSFVRVKQGNISYRWNHTSDLRSRCMERRSPGSAWRWGCSPPGFRWRQRPCSTRGRCYGPRASRRALWPIQGRFRCRSSCGPCSWTAWVLKSQNEACFSFAPFKTTFPSMNDGIRLWDKNNYRREIA